MKKITTLVCLVLVISVILSSMAMAEEKSRRAGSFGIKGGIIATFDKDVTVDGVTFTASGNTAFAIEGSYVIYSTDYVDLEAVLGGSFSGEDTSLTSPKNGVRSIYYLGGVKIYPTKETFYIATHVGGVTHSYKDVTVAGITIPGGDNKTNFVLRAGVGAEGKNVVFEGFYYMERYGSETLSGTNWPSYTQNGIQVMGGYKF